MKISTSLNQTPLNQIRNNNPPAMSLSFGWTGSVESVAMSKLLAADALVRSILHNDTEAFIRLVAQRVSLNQSNADGWPPLHLACTMGREAMVRVFINLKADLNQQDSFTGSTPLHLAILKEKPEIARMLIKEGANINLTDNEGNTPLDLAEACNDREIALLLRQTQDINTGNLQARALLDLIENDDTEHALRSIAAGANPNLREMGWLKRPENELLKLSFCLDKSPLGLAVERKNAVIVKALLKAGAEPNISYPKDKTLLSVATENGLTEIVQALLDAGANPNQHKKPENMPLYIAVNAENKKLVAMLLKAKANPDIQFKRGLFEAGGDVEHGGTALHRAVRLKDKILLRLFLEAGADPNFPNSLGSTPLLYASYPPYQNADIARQLMEAGAKLIAADESPKPPVSKKEKTVLHDAVKNEDESKLRALLAAETDLNAQDKAGMTPLILAVTSGKNHFVKLLAEAGANPDIQDREGDTALHYAALRNNPESIQLLHQAGANFNIKNKRGRTPLHEASWYGHDTVMKMLEAYGADVNLRTRYGAKAAHLYSRYFD